MFKFYLYTGLNYVYSEVSNQVTSVFENAFGLNVGLGAKYDFGRLLAFGDLKL